MSERRHACATCAPSGSTNDGRARYARFSWLDSHRIPRIRVVRSKGCGAIGSATVSKTVGCRFESCHPCAVDSAEVSSARRRPRLARTIVKRSEEHTSELQSRGHLVCRLLLEKKKTMLR